MKSLRLFAFFAVILAFLVVMLGAYTRLTHAGLGCPDWPGCYGHMLVPAQEQATQTLYPAAPLEARKAWTEMVHRYLAGSLALLIVSINILAWIHRRHGAPLLLPSFLLGLIGFQAALGMWTVTLKLLPIVVMGHLLGGLLIFGGLIYLNLILQGSLGQAAGRRISKLGCRYQRRIWLYVALGIVLSQIALGGWVSANYAGLACIGFPQCNGQWLPNLTWTHSFDLWSTIGVNYQGGILDTASRVTVQMLHRIGALITMIYLTCLSFSVLRNYSSMFVRWNIVLMLVCLLLQLTLGIINVLYMLPLWAAVAHNGVAALLLGTVIALLYTTHSGVSHVRSA